MYTLCECHFISIIFVFCGSISTGALSEVKRLSANLAALGESGGHHSEMSRLLHEIQTNIDNKAFNKLVATDSSIEFVVETIVTFLNSVVCILCTDSSGSV